MTVLGSGMKLTLKNYRVWSQRQLRACERDTSSKYHAPAQSQAKRGQRDPGNRDLRRIGNERCWIRSQPSRQRRTRWMPPWILLVRSSLKICPCDLEVRVGGSDIAQLQVLLWRGPTSLKVLSHMPRLLLSTCPGVAPSRVRSARACRGLPRIWQLRQPAHENICWDIYMKKLNLISLHLLQLAIAISHCNDRSQSLCWPPNKPLPGGRPRGVTSEPESELSVLRISKSTLTLAENRLSQTQSREESLPNHLGGTTSQQSLNTRIKKDVSKSILSSNPGRVLLVSRRFSKPNPSTEPSEDYSTGARVQYALARTNHSPVAPSIRLKYANPLASLSGIITKHPLPPGDILQLFGQLMLCHDVYASLPQCSSPQCNRETENDEDLSDDQPPPVHRAPLE